MYLTIDDQIKLDDDIEIELKASSFDGLLTEAVKAQIVDEVRSDNRDICIKSKMLDAIQLEFDKIEETL